MRGCWDGDGYVGPNEAKYSTVSRKFAYEMNFALRMFGINSATFKNRNTGLFNVCVSRFSFQHFLRILYPGKEQFDATWQRNTDTFITDSSSDRVYVRGVTSRSIKKKTKVYNFSVDEDETYVIQGGIVVHNCKNQEVFSTAMLMDCVVKQKLNASIKGWWKQCTDDAKKAKKKPLLIMTCAHQPVFVMMKKETFVYWLVSKVSKNSINRIGNLHIVLWKDFLKLDYTEKELRQFWRESRKARKLLRNRKY